MARDDGYPRVLSEDVARNLGAARFTVTGAEWAPGLSEDQAALLAPPVVVRAAAFPSLPARASGRHRAA